MFSSLRCGCSLRCRAFAMGACGPGNVGGKGLSIRPHDAILEVFLLPDGDGALQGVDEPAAGVECGTTMGGCDDDQNAGFSNFETSEAGDECDAPKRGFGQGPGR